MGRIGKTPRGKMMNQRDIAREYGVATSLVLAWVQKDLFPAPVRVVESTRIFRRADVEVFFRERGRDRPARG